MAQTVTFKDFPSIPEYVHYDPEFDFYIERAMMKSPSCQLHAHAFTELAIVMGGSVVHHTRTEEYPVGTGAVFVITDNLEHGYRDARNLYLCNIMYGSAFLTGYKELEQIPGYHALFSLEPFYRKHHRFQSRLNLDSKQLAFVSRLVGEMKREFEEKKSGHKPAIKALLVQLIIYLSRQYSQQKSGKAARILPLAECVAFMEENFSRKLALRDLAAIACMSVPNFVRVFKDTYRTTPVDYLIRLRVQKACEMLQNQEETVTSVALKSGF
ncbi:MAG: helix-turn-helix domain-containing protein [Candidatus Glassbacteria bacterium]|nr:helix-turn-helix domain-containing protein [Candidatus Glassbacteria bacterium]